MADEFSFQITGIEEACAMLDRVPKDAVKIGFARALAAAAVPVFQAVEARTPVRRGNLRRALRTDISIDAEGQGGVASINFGPMGHEANFVEYGHRMFTHYQKTVGSGKRKVRTGGHVQVGDVLERPFLRPAAAASGDAAVEEFTTALSDALVEGTTWADVGESVA